jgi:Peptidase A4 family
VNRNFVWPAVVLAILVLVFSAFTYYYGNYLAPSGNSGQPKPPSEQGDLNWAGYTVACNFSAPQPLVTEVQGSWIVPQLELSQNDTFSAVWIGIGGYFGHTLIQIGTEQDCIGRTAYYSAWFELLPADSITIQTMEVFPGDAITASISLTSPELNTWSINIDDMSTGQSYKQDFVYNSGRLSAEWIIERPDVNRSLSELADFGSVTMSNCSATINNEVGSIADFPLIRISMFDRDGTSLTDTSALGSDGSSFTVNVNAFQ